MDKQHKTKNDDLVRISANLSKSLLLKVDNYANRLGINRTSAINILLNYGINSIHDDTV